MPGLKAKINKRTIDAMKSDPDGKPVYLWDTQMAGFHFVLFREGIGAYRFHYRATRPEPVPDAGHTAKLDAD